MDLVNILNAIRAEGTTEYQDIVPVATRTNIASVGNPILTYATIQNQFLSKLVNKVAFQIVHAKTLVNPLAVLKKGEVPLGSDIEEIYTSPAAAEVYDPTGATLLTVKKPTVDTLYHRLNRQDMFRVSISRPQLQTAFTSYENLQKLVDQIVQTLYSGDSKAEFVLAKNLMADAVINSKIIVDNSLAAVTSDATGKAFIKAVKKAAKLMAFPGQNFNTYPVETWTPLEDQILIIRADIVTEVGVEVIASAFNTSPVALQENMVEVDTFGAAEPVMAILADKSLFQIYDNHSELTEFYNPMGLTWTYFWHHWQTWSISTFANAIAFRVPDYDIVAFDAIADITGGTTAAPTFANAAAVQAYLMANMPYVYADAGKVKVPVTAWVDTDSYNAAAAADYTFTATLGTLPYGVTNTTGGAVTAVVDVVVAAP